MDNRKPVYLLAGGRARRSDSLVQMVLKETGKASPSAAYIGAANDDNLPFFAMMAALAKANGVKSVERVLLVSSRAKMDKELDKLKSADLIFMAGGDVERGMEVIQERNLSGLLANLYDEGKVFFGTSAGSIMLAKEWIRWTDPDDDSSAEIFPCLGLAQVICDTHAEEDGWEELKALLKLEKDGTNGYGIASGTALKVYPDGRLEAFGGAVSRFKKQLNRVEKLAEIGAER